MPIHPVSIPAPTTPSPARSTQPHLRACATRAAVVATTAAAAALLTVLPATGAAPTASTSTASTSTASTSTASTSTASTSTALLTAPVVSTPVAPVAASAPAAAASARATAVQMALGKIGSPYRWGGTGPSSFDCSGLVSWAFSQAGAPLPRTSRAQSKAGTPVSRADLQPGDLVFFYSPVRHVGIYIGNGQMVHSSTSGKPVAVSPVDGRPFHSARRI